MASISWYTILFATIVFISGGAIGALSYAVISGYLNRKPKIGCRVDTVPIFEDISGASHTRSQIEISDGSTTYSYNNLQVVQVQVQNQSRQDFDRFEFGITLSGEDVLVHIEVQSPDRHHDVKQIDSLTFAEPKSKIDLILQPFNQSDHYTFRLLIITAQPCQNLGDINFSSPVAARFADMPPIEEALKETAKSTTISLGPFSFSFN